MKPGLDCHYLGRGGGPQVWFALAGHKFEYCIEPGTTLVFSIGEGLGSEIVSVRAVPALSWPTCVFVIRLTGGMLLLSKGQLIET